MTTFYAYLEQGAAFTVGEDVTFDDIVATRDPRTVPVGDIAQERPNIADAALNMNDERIARLAPLGPVTAAPGWEEIEAFACQAGWTVEAIEPLTTAFGPQAEQLVAAITKAEQNLHGDPDESETAKTYYEASDAFSDAIAEHEDAAEEALNEAGVDGWWWVNGFACTYGPEMVALAARDLIGSTPKWTMDAYYTMVEPWRMTFGPIHPDDTMVTAPAPVTESDQR